MDNIKNLVNLILLFTLTHSFSASDNELYESIKDNTISIQNNYSNESFNKYIIGYLKYNLLTNKRPVPE